jgi:ABC-type cobalamin/Fe3+-siderophores transport system ATPase subunit
MIKSTKPVNCQLRGNKKAIIQLEVDSFVQTSQGVVYTVIDYILLEENVKQFNSSKTVFYANEIINQLNMDLETQKDYSELSKTESDWAKIKDALFLDTKTNLYEDGTTIYGLQPNDWELC